MIPTLSSLVTMAVIMTTDAVDYDNSGFLVQAYLVNSLLPFHYS